jgi:hypothetical protein
MTGDRGSEMLTTIATVAGICIGFGIGVYQEDSATAVVLWVLSALGLLMVLAA